MSLYNLIHGENSNADLYLAILGLTKNDIPRYRDCFWNGTEICIYTRTGGGNRDYYESEEACRSNYPEDFNHKAKRPSGPWNEDLRKIQGYIRDEDDEYDCTYATFYFSLPVELESIRDDMLTADATPAQRWENFMAKLESKDTDDPQVKKALDAMKPLIEAVREKLKSP